MVEPGARRPTRSTWLTASRLMCTPAPRMTSRSRSEQLVRVYEDLRRGPAVGEGVLDLAGRAGIDADGVRLARTAKAAQDREDLRLAVGLEGEAEPMVESGASGSRVHGPDVLADPLEVVDEARRPLCPGQLLGIAAGDDQASVDGIEARTTPPVGRVRRGRLELERSRLGGHGPQRSRTHGRDVG